KPIGNTGRLSVAWPQRDSIFTRPSARGYPWCRASSQPQKVRFVRDPALEGDGFEPLVPQREGMGLFETTLIGLAPSPPREATYLDTRAALRRRFGVYD